MGKVKKLSVSVDEQTLDELRRLVHFWSTTHCGNNWRGRNLLKS
jgi:hypothetical protein